MPTIASITHSENSKRKSHRVTIPIQAIVNNYTYSISDWSMDGLRITLNHDNFKDKPSINDTLNIKLILPTGNSSIILDMRVIIKNVFKNTYGLQISEIGEKNRRVLRHYATLAIDGNIDHVDDLSGNLFMNNVPSPIKESILMSDIESTSVHKSFRKKLIINGSLGVIFLSISTFFLMYNYLVLKETTGLISGNSSIYSTPYDGVIKNIYVHNGERISKNQVLFEMQDKEYIEQFKILTNTQKTLQKQLKSYKRSLAKYKKYANQKLKEMKLLTENEIKLIKENLTIQSNTYERAKYLYENQLLSFSQFSEIQGSYLQYMDDYNAIVNKKRSINKNNLTLEQNYNKNQDHIISVQNSVLFLSKEIESNKLKISLLKNNIDSALIVASSSGKIYSINKQKGDFLHYSDNVLIVQTNNKPFVLIKTLSSEISAVTVGAPCIIKSSRTGKVYTAKITGIGYPAIDGINVGGNELSQNIVPIKVEFNDETVRFNLNEYVQIYLINGSHLANTIVKLTTGISLYD